MATELRLQKFTDAIRITSDIDNLDNDAPQVMRRTSASIQKTSTFVVAKIEPHDMVLPLNVIWFCFDPNSSYYNKALRRVSKDPSASFEHTWEVLYFYSDLWLDQHYAPEDLDKLTADIPGAATVSDLGLVLLATAPEDPNNPVVILEGDSRLTDARDPKPHSHPEKPATMLQHSDGVLTIKNSAAVAGALLFSTSTTEAEWRKPTPEDLGE
tara:strand:+ start:3733 stop:4368 length:636 start_codon:yes stop_codon:yes gene_type:complete